jgi:hypothetical protein
VGVGWAAVVRAGVLNSAGIYIYIYINIYGTKLISLDKYLNLVF